MAKKLSKSLIKKYSISYNDALSLGITNEDLKYISPKSANSYRVSVPNPNGKRKTKVEHDLLTAIHTKYDFIKEIKEQSRILEEESKKIDDFKRNITKYNLVREGIEIYMRERKEDLERGFIQERTYEQDYIYFKKAGILQIQNYLMKE